MQKGVRGKNLAGRQQTSQGVRGGGGVRTLSTRAKHDAAGGYPLSINNPIARAAGFHILLLR